MFCWKRRWGRRAILAGTVIDCTGDGDIAARAGAEFETGRPEDHLCQPMSQIFVTSGTNYPELYYGTGEDPDPNPLTRFRFRGAVKDAREKGILKENPNDILCAATPLSRNDPTVRAVNFTRIQKYSALDTDQKSAALAAGRRQVLEAMNFIRSPSRSTAKNTPLLLPVRHPDSICGDDSANRRANGRGMMHCHPSSSSTSNRKIRSASGWQLSNRLS